MGETLYRKLEGYRNPQTVSQNRSPICIIVEMYVSWDGLEMSVALQFAKEVLPSSYGQCDV